MTLTFVLQAIQGGKTLVVVPSLAGQVFVGVGPFGFEHALFTSFPEEICSKWIFSIDSEGFKIQ